MIPILLFSSPSGSGKTRFITNIITSFLKYGLNIGYIKHHHGNFYDKRIKDTGKMIQAGASRTLLIANDVTVLEEPLSENIYHTNAFEKYVNKYFKDCQLVLVEGFKENMDHPKVILWRGDLGENREWVKKRMLDKNIIALISDETLPVPYPIFKHSEYEGFCKFITKYFQIDTGN